MTVNDEIKEFIKKDVLKRFLKYVKMDTSSNEDEKNQPSSEGQRKLGQLLVKELKEIGCDNAELDKYSYLYANIHASRGVSSIPITFCAHLDTSPSENGKNVKPEIHKNYNGKNIFFKDDKELVLSPEECPELLKFKSRDIITASGTTLLGADDKAGVAEIMTALACFMKFEELIHPELRIVFTPDEEIGRGTEEINLKKLGKIGYTVDGDQMGVIEDECFNAYLVTISFYGLNVHPGYAKNKMINACRISARFVSKIPEYETPEHTEQREGFYHVLEIGGNENKAVVKILLRDFDEANNIQRIDYLKQLIELFKNQYRGLKTEMKVKNQYKNMKEILKEYPEIVDRVEKAVRMSGIDVIKKSIRGGTDGAKLSEKGVPTPNIFAGGMMFHSKKEWIPLIAMQKAVETIINLCFLWTGIN